MNEHAELLLEQLRSPGAEQHFRMSTWIYSPSKCHTVGCIAGTLIVNEYGLRRANDILYRDEREFISIGAELLGLPRKIAEHLFLPPDWMLDLQSDTFRRHHKGLWTDNWRCDPDTIEKMKIWALQNWSDSNADIYDRIGPLEAARALEQVCGDELPYVNWAKAIEPDTWETV